MTKFRVGLEPAEYLREVDDKLLRYVREVRDAPEVAIDTETTGLLTWREVPLFFSLAWQAPEGVVRRVCLPIRLIWVFEESFRDPEKKWILANAKFDMHMLANIGVRIAGPWYDVQVMHALLYEDEKHGLKAMHQAIFGWSWPDFGKTFGIKKGKNAPATGTVLLEMERTRPQVLAEYAANDAYGTLMLYYWLKDMLQKQPTWSAYPETYDTLWDIYYKTELPYTKVLWKCERRGMLLDLDYLDNCRGPIEDQIEELEREIVTLRGKMFNVDSTAELRTWFYNELHIKPLDWSKGGKNGKRVPKVEKEFFEHYAYYPAVKLVKEYNGLRKFLSTFVLPMWGIVDPESRIHTTLRQARASTGRLSCVAAWTPVVTPSGLQPIAQLRVGDYVYTHRHRWRRVLATIRKGVDMMYDVRLSTGEVLTCTAKHRLLTASGHWLSVGELIHECIQTVDGCSREPSADRSTVQVARATHRSADSCTAGHNPRVCHVCTKRRNSRHRLPGAESAAVLGFQRGHEEPHAGKGGRSTPVLEGRLRGRSGLPDLPAQRQASLCASRCDGASTRAAGTARVGSSAPRGRQQAEQCAGQPGAHDTSGTQRYPLLAGKGLDVCRIEEIVPRGCREVYDITVEEDESYEACGVFSHNSSDPNCQNVPNPDKDKHKVRKAFIAPPGKSLLVHDYDQLEMRLVAVGAQAWPMVQMFVDKKDIHIGNAVSVLNKLWQRKYGVTLTYDLIKEAKHQQDLLKKKQISPEEFTDTFAKCCLARGAVKAVGYGLNYGIGDDKLAGQIGCLPSEAYETRMEYFHEYPGIKMFFDLSVQIARHTGYAFTYLGRRRFLGQIHSRWQRDRAAAERRAGNMAIQGCLPASTRVLTTKGYLPIGDIPATGEVWTGHAFKPYKKLYRGAWELAELLLSNGQILSCDTRHKVLVATEQDYVFKSYEELEEGDRICLSVAQPVHFGRALPRGDAYWMGFALGNGCTAQGTAHHNALTITAGDRVGCYTKEGMTAAFSAYVQRLGISPQKPRRSPTKISVTVESAAFKDRWLRLGYCWGETAHTKRVPAAIWTASLSARKAFLRGMLDADGAVLHDTPNIHLCQRELLADLQMLFRTVGVDAVLRGPYVDGTTVSWRLDMSPGQLHAVFRIGTPRMPEITRMPVPAGVLRASEQSLRALHLLSKSQQTIRNRVLRGGPANTYTLLHLYDVAKRTPPQVYATRTLVRKVAIGRAESTYTLSVDDPGHRFDSEGVISKNTAAEVVKLAMLHCDEDPRLRELGAEMTMQVHDELLHEIPTDAAEEGDKRVREIMEHPFERDIGVPLTVGGGAAGNWYEAK